MQLSPACRGAFPRPLTDSSANEQLLYFTTPSLTLDSKYLVLISDRFHHGGVNLAFLDRATEEITPLTSFQTTPLNCYPYFDTERVENRHFSGGGNGRVGPVGLNKSSPSLHAKSGSLYYVYGRKDGWSEVCTVNVYSGKGRCLAELGPDRTVAYTHVSSDNRKLLLPVTDARILDIGARRTENRDVFEFFLANKLATQFLEIDVHSGTTSVLWEEPEWVTHVQYQPNNPDCILYNHEWRWPLGTERIWLRNKSDGLSRKMRPAGIRGGNGKATAETDNVSHEVWSPDGGWILYHGWGDDGTAFVGRMRPSPGSLAEIWFPPETKCAYGHFYHSPCDERIVTDALHGTALSRGGTGRSISLLTPDWENQTIRAESLCPTKSSWATQDDHPHPVIAPDGREVLFTSDKLGKRAVYSVDISDSSPDLGK